MSSIFDRYQNLGFKESLLRSYDYPSACNELSFILRSAYAQLPKPLQNILLQDTLAAFRLLPKVWTQHGVAAANLLLQAAEAALPKQKRVLAVTEFKHAVVAYKRNCKCQKVEEESVQLPQDLLIHIFSFLDLRSLVVVGAVCRSWNSASNDENLWQLQYKIFSATFDGSSENKVHFGEPSDSTIAHQKTAGIDHVMAINWREAFKGAYIGKSSRRFTSNRGYCWHCRSMVWLNNMKCSNVHHGSKYKNHQIKPISPQEVVEYLLADAFWTISSSDSDSDSDEGPMYKLWAYGKCIGNTHGNSHAIV